MKRFNAYFEDGRESIGFGHSDINLVDAVANVVRSQGGHIGWLGKIFNRDGKEVAVCIPED